MAQINASKSFDEQSIDPKTLDPLRPLIEFINQNFDQLIRALTAQLTLAENTRGRLITVQAYANQPTLVDAKGVTGMSVLSCENDGISSLKYVSDQSGKLSITFRFQNAIPIKTRSVSYSAPFSTYEVQASLAVVVGDRVVITGYGNKENNGEFLVIARTSNSIVVYNANSGASSETRADFTGTAEAAKNVTLFMYS